MSININLMRNLIFFACIYSFIPISVEACSCFNSDTGVNNRFIYSDVAVEGQVLDVNENGVISFAIMNMFKGNLKRERIEFQTFDFGVETSCDMFFKKGEKWILFLEKDSKGLLRTGYCSGSKQYLDSHSNESFRKNNNQSYERIKDQLFFLKKHASEINRSFYIFQSTNWDTDFFNQYDDINFEQSNAQYRIFLNSELKVYKVETLRGFSESFDNDFKKLLLENSKWTTRLNLEIEGNVEHIVGVYKFKADDNGFFLTLNDLIY